MAIVLALNFYDKRVHTLAILINVNFNKQKQ